MSKYLELLKRRKEGEIYVETVCHLSEQQKERVEQFRKEHPHTSTAWFDHRFNEKIS